MFLEKKKIIQNELKLKPMSSYIILGRESSIAQDPVCEILDFHFIGLTGVLFTENKVIAIVNSIDFEGYRQMNKFDEVILYTDFEKTLSEVLEREKIESLAANFSENDPSADGLSSGLFIKLNKIIKSLPREINFISAYSLVLKIRGIKTREELEKIRTSGIESLKIFYEIGKEIRVGDNVEKIFKLFQNKTKNRGYGFAWTESFCPGIKLGPKSPAGHLGITDITSEKGFCMTVDFGVKHLGYCADLQRVYYFMGSEESEIPFELERAFRTCKEAIRKAADFIKEGVTGYEVDKVARDYIKSCGYPEWNYALGHQVGRQAHDGGTLLAPDKTRYNRKELIHTPLDSNNIFTLELGVPTPYGYVGLEEMVLVGKERGEFIVPPQESIIIIS